MYYYDYYSLGQFAMEVTGMIAVQVGIEDRVIDLSHLMMHRVKAFTAMIAVSVIRFKTVEHLSS
jgi:hypothetical protein